MFSQTKAYRMQDIYDTGMTIVGIDEQPFDRPSDLFIDDNDEVFIADTGNSRVVHLDKDGHWIRDYGDEEGQGRLNSPEGVFVTPEGLVYVADTGNRRVAVFNQKSEFIREYAKPEEVYLPDNFYFVPSKLSVDARGVVYIVSKGSYQGIIRLTPEGSFSGFYGANKSNVTLLDRIKRVIFTEEQMARETIKRPTEITNITLDSKGFIFTATHGALKQQIKKLNAAGEDRFDTLLTANISTSDRVVDIAVDDRDFFYVLDRSQNLYSGMISVYSPNGLELFRFGNIKSDSAQRGILDFPVSIGVNSTKQLWVLDSNHNLIQVFNRTDFGKSLLSAAADYYIGDYENTKAGWKQVSELNEVISLTYSGLGKVAQKEGQLEEAMTFFKKSLDADSYSEVFWDYRYLLIERFFVYLFGFLVALWLLNRFVIRKYWGSWFKRLPSKVREVLIDLKQGWYIMRHPYEGFYKLKDTRVSLVSLLIIIVLVIIARLANLFATGFVFNPVDLARIDVTLNLLLLLIPIATWIVANYLISTIKDGEGRFYEVLQSSIYAMFPYIVFTGPLIFFSRILVLDEGIIVSATNMVMWVWIVVLFLIKSQVIHNFDFVENIKNSLITVFTIIVIWLFVGISAGLTYNLWDFVYQFYREVLVLG